MTGIHYSVDTTLTLQSLSHPDVVYSPSLFTTHQLRPGTFSASQQRPMQPDWISGILIFCFMLFAWTQVFYYNRIRQVLKAPFSKRFINQLTRDGNLFKERTSVSMGTIYLLTFSLLLYEFNAEFLKITLSMVSGVTLYLAIVVFNLALLFVKVSVVQLLGIVFKTKETTYNYLLNLLIFALLSGPVMLAALVLIIYLKWPLLLHICVIAFIFMFLFRFLRSFLIGITLSKFSYLFLFVYLCSLEILPLLVIMKILLNQA